MVLALVDDLLFSSKIRAAAAATGTELIFVRATEHALDEVRARHADLLILDLDRAPLDPIEVIRQIKSQPDLSHVRVVGFVSHVHTEIIEAARAAGIDQVLARSAFFSSLPRVLGAGQAPPESAE
jgi:CheY-like chemotaxis protein